MSNIAAASSGCRTGNSIGREFCRPSTCNAADRDIAKLFHRLHSGFQLSTAIISRKVANASLSHSPFHQSMVTKSPNHICAFSWETTSATRSNSLRDAVFSSISRAVSRNVIAPKFSIAPAAKSGIATRSSLSPGYPRL